MGNFSYEQPRRDTELLRASVMDLNVLPLVHLRDIGTHLFLRR
jgi:hypothetical protein